jgi:hypothetical protein
MGSDAADATLFHFDYRLEQILAFNSWQLKDGAHGTSHRAPKEGAAGGFTNNQSLSIKGRAVTDKGAEIFSIRKVIDRNKKVWFRASIENLIEGKLGRYFGYSE